MLRRVLHDQERRLAIGDVVVTPAAWSTVDRNAVEQVGREIERLIEARQIAFAAERNTDLPPDRADATVTADDELRADVGDVAVEILDACRRPVFRLPSTTGARGRSGR